MNDGEALDEIRSYGDLLERHMFAVDEFAHQFSIYPLVWTNYILPNRKPGTLTLANRDWIRFAERHCSSIVRCWNTRQAKQRIDDICQDNVGSITASSHLDIHEALLTFFCSAGAAIDNLRYAFQAEPLQSGEEFEKIARRADIDKNLHWIYERRTQYIHKAVVPCFGHDGLLSFDATFFDDTETQWHRNIPIKVECVSDLVGNIWQYFSGELHAAWSRLLELLKSLLSPHARPVYFESREPDEPQYCSGGPLMSDTSPSLPPPSGSPIDMPLDGGIDLGRQL